MLGNEESIEMKFTGHLLVTPAIGQMWEVGHVHQSFQGLSAQDLSFFIYQACLSRQELRLQNSSLIEDET